MNSIELPSIEIHCRHTGPEGNSFVQHHIVWNKDKFLADQNKTSKVELITLEDYRNAKKYK